MKCTQCNKTMEETFMEKIKGTYIKGKPYCSDCQKDLLKKKVHEKPMEKAEQ